MQWCANGTGILQPDVWHSPCLSGTLAASCAALASAAALGARTPRWTSARDARWTDVADAALALAALLALAGPLANEPVVYGGVEVALCVALPLCAVVLTMGRACARDVAVARATLAVVLLAAGGVLLWSASLSMAAYDRRAGTIVWLAAGSCVMLAGVIRTVVFCVMAASSSAIASPAYALLTVAADDNALEPHSAVSLEDAELRFAHVVDDPESYLTRNDTVAPHAEPADAAAGKHFMRATFRAEWLRVVGALGAALVAVAAAFGQNVWWGIIVGIVSTSPVPTDAASLLLEHSARLLLLCAVGAAASALESTLARVAALRIATAVRLRVFASIVERPMASQDATQPGALLSRLTNDVESFAGALGTHSVRLLKASVTAVAGVVFLLILSWELTLGLLACLPIIAFVTWLQTRRAAATTARSLNASAAASASAEEAFAAARTVRAFRTQHLETVRYARHATAAYLLAARLAVYNGFADALTRFLFEATVVGGIFFAGRRVLLGYSTVGTTVTYLLVVMELAFQVDAIPEAVAGLGEGAGAAASLVELLDVPRDALFHEKTDGLMSDAADAAGGDADAVMQLDGVCFAYATRPSVPVLRDVSVCVQRGQTLAIVGASGSGKSSIVSLLLRLYNPTSGIIRLRGRDLRAYSERELADLVCLVPQEPVLFHTSVRDNIAYGCAMASQVAVERAAQQANAHAFIAALPQGYDTDVGAHGGLLSGGQRQRICIARALIRDPPVLVCDEPTSSLDAESETVVVATLRAILAPRERVVVLVTHNASLVRHADRVAFIAQGQVAAWGTHADLMRTSQMYRRHFGADIDESE